MTAAKKSKGLKGLKNLKSLNFWGAREGRFFSTPFPDPQAAILRPLGKPSRLPADKGCRSRPVSPRVASTSEPAADLRPPKLGEPRTRSAQLPQGVLTRRLGRHILSSFT